MIFLWQANFNIERFPQEHYLNAFCNPDAGRKFIVFMEDLQSQYQRSIWCEWLSLFMVTCVTYN